MTTVPDWDEIGDLRLLRRSATARSHFATGGLEIADVRPNHLRLKRGESALVGFEMDAPATSGSPTVIHGYARTFTDPDRAEALFEKARSKGFVDSDAGPGVVLLPGGRTVVFTFPNDAGLPGAHRIVRTSVCLRTIADLPTFAGRRFSKRRSSSVVVRYKPERRFIARLHAVDRDEDGSDPGGEDLFVRWFGDGRGAIGDAVGAALAAAGVNVAKPLGATADGRLSVESAVPGVDGVAALVAGLFDTAAVGHGLASLHAATTTTRIVDRRTAPESVRSSALAALDTVAMVEPRLAGAACRLAVALRSTPLPPDAAVGIHGDLHLGQVIASHGQVSFIDLERFTVGSPLIDVASFIAHLIEMESTHPSLGPTDADQAAFRTAWSERSGHGDDGFGSVLACALVERVLLGFRTFDPEWVPRAEVLLDRAADAIGTGRWSVIHPRPNGSWTASGGGIAPQSVVLEADRVDARSPSNDPDLPGLAPALDLGALKAYRPGRRAVVATADGSAFVKVLRPKRAGGTIDRWRSVSLLLAGDPSAPHVPEILDTSRPSDGIVVLGALAGRPLHDVLVDERDPSLRSDALAEATDLVVRFHQVDADGIELPVGSDGGRPIDWVAVLRRVHPELANSYDAVAESLGDPPPSGLRSLVHGDLHDRNVLLDGARGGIIDLDGVGVGDPAIDVGNLAAHVVLRALQRGDEVADGRAEALAVAAGHPAGESAAPWVARTLFRLAVLYRFRIRWAHLTPILLRESVRWSDADGLGPT